LAKLRTHSSDKGGDKRHALVESVTSERDGAHPDDSPNIVDRITGRMHQGEPAAAQAQESSSSSSSSASASSKTKPGKSKGAEPKPSSGVDAENDPISGLGL
jgi:hypothetical protein